MSTAKSVRVKNNRHSSGIDGIKDLIEFLEKCDFVDRVKPGQIINAGGAKNRIIILKSADFFNGRSTTKVQLKLERTNGSQMVVVVLTENFSQSNTEPVNQLFKVLKQQFAGFDLVNQLFEVPAEEALVVVQDSVRPTETISSPTVTVIETPEEIKEVGPVVLLTSHPSKKRIQLSRAQTRDYEIIKSLAVDEEGLMIVHGDPRKTWKINYASKQKFVDLGVLVSLGRGKYAFEEMEIETIIRQIKKKERTMPRRKNSEKAAEAKPNRPSIIILDVGKPEEFKQCILKAVCLGPDGKLRTSEEMKLASSLLFDAATTLEGVSNIGPMAYILLELGRTLK